jgi:non-ribosomal peptide synthetase component F
VLARDASTSAHAVAVRARTSLPTVLLAGFASALGRYTRQPDVVIGSAVSRRAQDGTAQMLGPFMNTLPLRIRIGDQPTLRTILPGVRSASLAALDHQDAPFRLVVEQATAAHGPAASGIGQVAFVMEDAERGEFTLGGLTATLELPARVTSRRDLTLTAAVANGDIVGTITYDRDLFDIATIERISEDWESAMASAQDCA